MNQKNIQSPSRTQAKSSLSVIPVGKHEENCNKSLISLHNSDVILTTKWGWTHEDDFQPLQSFVKEPEYYLRNMTEVERAVLNLLIMMADRFPTLYPSQSYIADQVRITRPYCNTVLKRLKGLGLIDSFYRHMKTNRYRLSSYFLNPFVRSSLSHLLKSLRLLPLLLLICPKPIKSPIFQKPVSKPQLTQLNKQGYKDIKSLIKSVIPGVTVHDNNKFFNVMMSDNGNYVEKRDQIDISIDSSLQPSNESYHTLRNQINILQKNASLNSSSALNPIAKKIWGENPISPAIRSLKDLNLTKWGQIKLSAFPDEAIHDTAEKMKYHNNIRDPFNWFFKLCLEYCEWNEIKPDWQWSYDLAKNYKMPEDAPMVLETKKVAEEPMVKRSFFSGALLKPTYIRTEQQQTKREEPKTGIAPRSSAYQPAILDIRTPEDPAHAAKVMENWRMSEDGKKFTSLFGELHPWWMEPFKKEIEAIKEETKE